MNPTFPIYVISKGRADRCLTARTFDAMRVPYSLVVEPQEQEEYRRCTRAKNILTLPFSNLGLGSIPARNWVWEDSIARGYARHWILDDNIAWFYRWNHSVRLKVMTGAIFKAAEDFVERYENVAIAGFNYRFLLAPRTDRDEMRPPYWLNNRVYSCILIKNDTPFRWRGRYNEDTDLCLRVLKAGLCTMLFNAFLCGKVGTLSMKGGNTDELYAGDGRRKMAESLVEQHPDVAKIVWKFKRWQHEVNYRPFWHNQLIRKPGIVIPQGINEYGMVLKRVDHD